MLEFKVIENLKPNKDLTDILKEFKYKVKLGQIKTILHTNLQVVIPTEYQVTYPTTLTILEYKVNEISNKPFYIKEHNQKYNIKEIIQFLKRDNKFQKRGKNYQNNLILFFVFFEYGNKTYVQPALNLYFRTNSFMKLPCPF